MNKAQGLPLNTFVLGALATAVAGFFLLALFVVPQCPALQETTPAYMCITGYQKCVEYDWTCESNQDVLGIYLASVDVFPKQMVCDGIYGCTVKKTEDGCLFSNLTWWYWMEYEHNAYTWHGQKNQQELIPKEYLGTCTKYTYCEKKLIDGIEKEVCEATR